MKILTGLITLMVLMCNSIPLFANENDKLISLIVQSKNGTKVSYVLKDLPKITVSDKYLIISTNGIEVNYEIAQLSKFTYDEVEFNSIININGDAVNPFEFMGDELLFPSVYEETNIEIYTIEGKLILQRKIQNGKTLSISIASWNKGIYLVNVNGVTYKIMKR